LVCALQVQSHVGHTRLPMTSKNMSDVIDNRRQWRECNYAENAAVAQRQGQQQQQASM